MSSLTISFFIFILGLCLGSFCSVLIWRIPKGFSIGGRSVCEKCGSKISWFDNIPLLSFILLRDRCRNCKVRISLRGPLVELATGVIFLLLYFNLGLTYQTFLLFLLSPILISIFFIDLDHQVIPDSLIFTGTGILFFYLLFISPQLFYLNVFAGFLSSLFLLILHFITKGKGMGLGDVKFAIMGGMVVGPTNLFYWFLIAFLTGAFVGCILILIKKYGLKSRIAFGPFLIFALLLTVLLR